MVLTSIMGIPHPDSAALLHKAFRSVRRPHARLILHWRGLGKNSHAIGSAQGREPRGGRTPGPEHFG